MIISRTAVAEMARKLRLSEVKRRQELKEKEVKDQHVRDRVHHTAHHLPLLRF